MSRIRANKITNQLADGSPTVEKGLVISGVTTSTTFSGSGANLTNLDASDLASGTVPTARLGSGTASSSTFLAGDSTSKTITGTTINNNADNRLITGSGTANTLNGETNLTYNGTKLSLTGNSASPVVEFINTSGAATQGAVLKLRASGRGGGIDDEDIFLITNNSDTRTFGVSNAGTVNTIGDIKMATGKGINSSGIVTATAFVPTTGQLSHRNAIVNGGCIVAQRSTSSTSSGLGSVDRMKMSVTKTDQLAFAQKQTSDGPDGFKKCFEFDVTTAESALAVDELVYMRYGVEAQDLVPFYNANGSGKNFTLSFYVKAYQTGTYQVSIYKDDNGTRFITRTYTISASATWQRVVLNFTGDTGAYPVNADNGLGFWIDFKLAAGTNYTSGGQVTTWGSFGNSVFAGGHAVNVLSSTDNYWRITGIQLELGDTATPFEHRSYGEELLRCKRYYQRSTDSSRGTDYTLSTGTWHSADGSQSFSKHNSYYDWKQNFEVEMRVAPTLTIYGSSNQGDIHLESIAVGSKQVDWNNNTTEVKTKGFLLRHIEDQSSGNYTSGSGNAFGILAYTVDAEL